MEQTQPSPQTERQRKFLLILPVLGFPFITFLLWSMGLIGTVAATAQTTGNQKGFNVHLPDAKLKADNGLNKLKFYEQAEKDSARYKEQMKNDPYFALKLMDTNRAVPPGTYGSTRLDYDPSPNSNSNYKDPNEERVNQKLAELNTALNKQNIASQSPAALHAMPVKANAAALDTNGVNRLQGMLQSVNQRDTGADPELQQLNGMMDKILDIQHPQRVNERIKEQSVKNKTAAYPVTAPDDATVSSLQSKTDSLPVFVQRNAFYSPEDKTLPGEQQNTIQAVVAETQTLVSGSTVKLRLVNDIYINGVLVPKGDFIYGMASLNGERLNIAINTVRYQNYILPVSLYVYDLDGVAGIFIPGAISRDVAKQSADESIQGVGLTTLDPSIGAQAASAGIQAAKTLIGKKVKLIKVTVKSGYQVLLRDTNNKQ